MSWLRVEGRMPQHHKIAPLSDAAFRLHVTAMAWAVEAKTDGRLPARIPATLTRAPAGKKLKEAVSELVDACAWRRDGDDYVIHDFLQWNPSAAELAAKSEAKSKAGAAGGKRSSESRARRGDEARSQAPAQAERQAPASARRQANAAPVAAPSAQANAQAPAQAESKPIPDPNPRSQSLSAAEDLSEDLTGFPRETPGSETAAAADSGVIPKATEAPSPIAEVTDLTRKYEFAQKNPGAFALEGGVRWPEFLAVWHAWCRPFGITEPPSITQRIDRDILTIVEAFASGKTLEQLLAAGKAAETDDYFKGLTGGGPASFTPAVLRRLLAPPRVAAAGGRRRGGPPQPDHGKTGWEGQE